MSDPLIVVAGENLVDRIVAVDGRTVHVPGGGPFNTARALGRLGARVAYLGRISTDPSGERLRAALVEDGVDLALAVSTDDPTLIARVSLDADGVATYGFDCVGSAAAGLRPSDFPPALPAETVALHVGTLGLVLEPMASTVAGLVGSVRPDVLVMLDPNIRPAAITDEAAFRARLAKVLSCADIVKVSREDLAWLEPNDSSLAVARHLMAGGASAVLVTAGSSSVEVVARAGTARFDVPLRTVVDTVGAGDAFGAGFLARWVEDGQRRADAVDPARLGRAVRTGIAAAGWTVERLGADPPRRADLGEVV